MSLHVDDSDRRGRSHSFGGVRGPDEDGERDRSRVRITPNVVDVPYPASTDSLRSDPSSVAYEYERLSRWPAEADTTAGYYPPRQPRDSPPAQKSWESEKERKRRLKKEKLEEDLAYGKLPGPSKYDVPPPPRQESYDYAPPKPPRPESYEYAPPKPPRPEPTVDDRDDPYVRVRREAEYTYERDERRRRESESDSSREGRQRPELYLPAKYAANIVTVEPESPPPESAKPSKEPRYRPTHLEVQVPDRSSSADPPSPIKSAMKRDRSRSPMPPTARRSTLSVDDPRPTGLSVSTAPASPLLEAYQGTWQSLSPMPSPILPSSADPQIFEALSPVPSEDDRAGDKRRARRARFNDPADDAARLAKALKGERRAPDTEPLIEILPGLTHEQVMELRAEYKRIVKTGSEGKGVNIAKHIRSRLKDEDPNLMKACYATALGRWESEAYWANFWYHGDKTRRELLIESLMGRTNDEIRQIKEAFRDKKYGNSLTKCMRTELKEDKFKKAVLMVLDEQRMEEVDPYGRPLRIDYDLVDEDVRQLHHAVRSEKGGETLMMTIVTQRSDAHLREVLREYKEKYRGANFAKEALKKSGNLVVSIFFLFFFFLFLFAFCSFFVAFISSYFFFPNILLPLCSLSHFVFPFSYSLIFSRMG